MGGETGPTAGGSELRELRGRLRRDAALRAGIAVLAVAFGGFVAWAALAPLTEGVVVTGAVVVDTAHKTVRHLEGGIVAALHVQEGSEVSRGDTLLELSETQARARLETLESRWYSRLAAIDRLRAESAGHDAISFSEALAARRDEAQIARMLAIQQDLFDVRRRQYGGQAEILRHRIAQLEEKIRGLEASRQAHERERALIEEELDRIGALHERQLVEESVLVSLRREYERSAGDAANTDAQIAGAHVAIGEAQQEIIQLEHAFLSEVADSISTAQQEWFELDEQIAALRDVLRRTRILAPQDGKVIGLAVHAAGAVVPAASPIMSIVPSEERLMVEGRVRPTDVNSVLPGQEARLRFAAFNRRTTPEIAGTVDRVSADIFQDSDTKESWYRVRVRVSAEELARLGEASISPGMPVDIMFTGGKRTTLQYLVDPLSDILKKAMVEE